MGLRWGHISAVAVGAVVAALGLSTDARACSNDLVRVGQSADLLDCRAYELVTPAGLDAFPRTAAGGLVGPTFAFQSAGGFASAPSTADGDSFLFAIFGLSLPGLDGNGVANAYRAQRSREGWSTALAGPTGKEAANPSAVGFSDDQSFQAFRIGHLEGRYSGTLDLGGGEWTSYVRHPDGRFGLVGEGTLPASPDGDGYPNGLADEVDSRVDVISPGGDHVIFSQGEDPIRLLSAAPAEGVRAIYDRTPQGLRLVSLLPDGLPSSLDSTFEGAAPDGSTILFQAGDTLYVRRHGSVTQKVASGALAAAGLSEDGTKVFYVDGSGAVGDLYAYDTRSEETTAIAATGDASFVNLSGDGSNVFFVSPSLLAGPGGVAGEPNLYVWNGTSVTFIATVSQSDLLRQVGKREVGLTQLVQQTADAPSRDGGFLFETSRVNRVGTAFAFESDAGLTSSDSNGKGDVYLYEVPRGRLVCVSCGDGSGARSTGSTFADYTFADVGSTTKIANLTADGRVVFFQSDDSLIPADTNGTTDVYEWSEGRLALISTGHDPAPSLLLGATPDGHDVFIRTAERLVAGGQEQGVQAVYDARVGGGFPPPAEQSACLPDECRGEPAATPEEAQPGSAGFLTRPRAARPRQCARKHPRLARHRPPSPKCPKRHRHRKHRGSGPAAAR